MKLKNQDNTMKLKDILNEAIKSPDYIITSVTEKEIPPQAMSKADVMLGLKMGGEFGMRGTLNKSHYKLDYHNGKVALILSNDGKRAIRVRSEKEPKYLDKIQKFASDFLSDYAKKIKK
jgi:hypothetical protein